MQTKDANDVDWSFCDLIGDRDLRLRQTRASREIGVFTRSLDTNQITDRPNQCRVPRLHPLITWKWGLVTIDTFLEISKTRSPVRLHNAQSMSRASVIHGLW